MSEIKIYLENRIDSQNADKVDGIITGELLKEHNALVFDAAELVYISSAGLRALLKAVKSEEAAGHEKVRIINASRDIYDILEMTGFSSLMEVSRALRKVEVDGCEVIGRGFYGTVYRLDEDTIVKVYSLGEEGIPIIRREQEMAKLAFLNGVPTAISYDIVKVGEDYGSMFELLRSDTFNDLIIKYPERTDETVRRYADFLRQIHGTEIIKGDVPDAGKKYLNYLYGLKDILTVGQIGMIRQLIIRLPEYHTMVHGDVQMKNVMLYNNEPMLIDMDNMGVGSPIFDFAGLFVTYKLFKEDEPGNPESFLGISQDKCDEIWDKLMRYYFDTGDTEELSAIEDKIRLMASIRFLNLLTETELKNSALTPKRIEHTVSGIDALLERVGDLDICNGDFVKSTRGI